ncbi:hypothetical protein [Jeongeupia sp. USM3]|uniref:hypothetical protein n=1 Tax=Jeongeupia sp. USM3 TaxID=1906741 RepID=UPI000AA3D1E3|nr:hypothetical protein [Jeongeupia sp. USM3]
MTFVLGNAVVVDDAFGPPVPGALDLEDKSNWVEHIADSDEAQNALRMILHNGQGPGLDELLTEATSDHAVIVKLWAAHTTNAHPLANLGLLFGKAILNLQGQKSTPQLVADKLKILCGSDNVRVFSDMESALPSLSSADIAFVDFYLGDDERDEDAFKRITKHAEALKQVKLLFIMSSRAELEIQQKVRGIVRSRTSFFDVLRKHDISIEVLDHRISRKTTAYVANKALEAVIENLVEAAEGAIEEFKDQCDDLEVHDLRLLDLARLDAEEEPIPEYLTWLFSEALAAKTRRIALPSTLQNCLKTESIGFSGQIQQGRSLSSMFAEVVFAPPIKSDASIRFGEVLTDIENEKYFLIITPACDLQRCELTKSVLCVGANATNYNSYKDLAEQKLYGKHNGGIRHLLCSDNKKGTIYTMLTWQADDIVTHTIQELQSKKYKRIALMNEIFAQEVKEEVLRTLGRVGTQIDPPPAIALQAKLRWKDAKQFSQERNSPKDFFISALLTYSEVKKPTGKRDVGKSVVLSDEFKDWALKTIRENYGEEVIPEKIKNCMQALQETKQFTLGEKKVMNEAGGELKLKLLQAGENTEMEKCSVEITLLVPDITVDH